MDCVIDVETCDTPASSLGKISRVSSLFRYLLLVGAKILLENTIRELCIGIRNLANTMAVPGKTLIVTF